MEILKSFCSRKEDGNPSSSNGLQPILKLQEAATSLQLHSHGKDKSDPLSAECPYYSLAKS